jgi:heme-binding protein
VLLAPADQFGRRLVRLSEARGQGYSDLRGILAPIGDTERQCNVTALPPRLESAYQQFMAG